MVDLKGRDLARVRSILARRVPTHQVRVFGSRVGEAPKPYSDLDLVIIGTEPLDERTLALLKDDFRESDIPFKMDVVDWHRTSARFRKIIETTSVPLPISRTNENSLIE